MWQVEWRAISARIEGLYQAASSMAQLGASVQAFQGSTYLVDEMAAIAAAIELFEAQYPDQIHLSGGVGLRDRTAAYVRDARGQPDHMSKVQLGVPFFIALRSEVQYLLGDVEVIGRSLVLRAFEHLKRCMVADRTTRATWQSAFTDKETACEKLGACHLLLHGVWAFKADAAGERTDLVLGTPLQIMPAMRASADVFALTEWKKVLSAKELDQKYADALSQAKRYSSASGSLAGFELSSRRFLVMVSKDLLPNIPDPHIDGSVTYECINIAVDPSTPSKTPRQSGD